MILDDYRNERLRKLDELRARGVEPYPSKSYRDTPIRDVVEHFDEKDGATVCVAGRIVAIRSFGKLVFLKIRDVTGEVQIFMKAAARNETTAGANMAAGAGSTDMATGVNKTTGDADMAADASSAVASAGGTSMTTGASDNLLGAREIKLLDVGDFIEAKGTVGKSQTGEISVFTDFVRLLTKSLRPMPEQFTNKEERYRRRYVDMNVNPEVRERLVRRSRFWQATREFMTEHGFIEVNIPVLEHTTGGADAEPFVTHMNALDEDFYLRISHELPLKRLIGGGFEKVFDIGPRFRNEGIDDEHLPEHIAFESYAAYENYEDGIKFYEEMIKYVALKTWGTLQFKVGGFDINLDCEWSRYKYADLLKEKFGVDVFNPDRAQILEVLSDNGVEVDAAMTTPHLIDHVWKLIRKTSAGPYWVIEEPLALSPLAKKSSANPLVTERFHPVIAGTEMGNGFSELNDPLDQLQRFQEQQAARDAGDEEAQMLDMDFVEMLEYGMPPTCGWGNSERNFWLLEGVPGREAVPFPTMKSVKETVNGGERVASSGAPMTSSDKPTTSSSEPTAQTRSDEETNLTTGE